VRPSRSRAGVAYSVKPGDGHRSAGDLTVGEFSPLVSSPPSGV
jgi:hypothetical protein